MIFCADLRQGSLERLFDGYGIEVRWVAQGGDIPGSHWGEPEAGIVGSRLFVRADTPLHSALHEGCHLICMGEERRVSVDRDAGGDDLEESAVCYLQIVLADYFDGVGRSLLMRDMDEWGYSFRLGSTLEWFLSDADDALSWLQERGFLDASGATVLVAGGEDPCVPFPGEDRIKR